jgi:peptide methionine sulfoxide reductase MsrB
MHLGKILTEQYFILREKGTASFSKQTMTTTKGHYFCAGCKLPLLSKTKFNSGTDGQVFMHQ